MRLVLNSQDINQALKSKAVVDRLQNLGLNILQTPASKQQRLEAGNPRVEFLPRSTEIASRTNRS